MSAGETLVDALLAPIGLAGLVRDHWGRTPFLARRGDSVPLFELPDVAAFRDLLLTLAAPAQGWFSLVRVRGRPPGPSHLNADGWVDGAAVWQEYRAGTSLLLNQVQRRHAGTARLCRALERGFTRAGVRLGRHIGGNLYLSPPDSQGFSIHYDPHDVLVVQLAGRKHWRLYGRRFDNPARPLAEPVAAEDAGGLAAEIALDPGDCLYLPSGTLHEACTHDSQSLHLTLILEPLSWGDLLREVVEADPALRDRLPAGSGRDDGADFAGMIERLRQSPAIRPAMAALRARLLARLDRPVVDFSQAAAADISADTELRLAPGIFGFVAEEEDRAILHLPGAHFAAAPAMAESFRMILERKGVRACDLPVNAPVEEKIGLLRSLLEDGYLVPGAPGA